MTHGEPLHREREREGGTDGRIRQRGIRAQKGE